MSTPKERLCLNEAYEGFEYWDIQSFQQLDPDVVDGIVDCIASSGMIANDQTKYHIKGDMITVHKDVMTDKIVAYSSTRFASPNEIFESRSISDTCGCYLAGAAIAAEHQNQGLYTHINDQRIGAAVDRHVPMIFTRTKILKVQAGIQSVLDNFFHAGKINGYSVEARGLRQGCSWAQDPFSIDYDEIKVSELDFTLGVSYILLFNIDY